MEDLKNKEKIVQEEKLRQLEIQNMQAIVQKKSMERMRAIENASAQNSNGGGIGSIGNGNHLA